MLFDTVNLDRWVSGYFDANRRRNIPARPDRDGARGFMRPVLYAQLAAWLFLVPVAAAAALRLFFLVPVAATAALRLLRNDDK